MGCRPCPEWQKSLQRKSNRHGIFHTHRLTLLIARSPARKALYNPYSFLIQHRFHTFYHLNIFHIAIFTHNETNKNTTLNTISCATVGYFK